MSKQKRSGGRKAAELRKVVIRPNYLDAPLASALIEFGRTRVISAASVEEKVPRWIKANSGNSGGWVTAEYSMLPYSTGPGRTPRESFRGRIAGRTHEIQRLIGRSLRAVTNLEGLGERTICIDCDVIQADGGTRTASITAGFVVLLMALRRLKKSKGITVKLLDDHVAAVSAGIVDGELLLDLDYFEDSRAEVDMNLVMTGSGKIIEIQGTAEGKPFSGTKLRQMIKMGQDGIAQLIEIQERALKSAALP